MRRAGRLHAPAVEAIAAAIGDGVIELRAPSPGVFVPRVASGDAVTPGSAIGALEVLGRTSELIAPRATPAGVVVRAPSAARAVGYGDAVVAVDPSHAPGRTGVGAPEASAAGAVADGILVFRAPTSGRFYSRPGPDKPVFVAEGTELAAGATICLLEVMKTFHRVTYGGAGLPDTARVTRVLVADGDDVNAGDPLIALA